MSHASSSSIMPNNKVIGFSNEYKALLCSCCSHVIGYEHKISGDLYCVGGCLSFKSIPNKITWPSILTFVNKMMPKIPASTAVATSGASPPI